MVQRLMASCPADVQVTEEEALWFLRDRYYDVSDAQKKLCARVRWRANFGRQNERVVTTREAKTGKGYLAGCRDVLGRPVTFWFPYLRAYLLRYT